MPIKGDFISFYYNGVHSTELGIVHVSSSDRYADALLPTIQDKAVLVPGSDGTYFFGSYYTQRPITLNIAFDSVTEDLFRRARALFGDKLSHPLVFDEEPYKVYYAKVTGTPQYNYICFGSPRVYKGEGTINFICYDPFAHCLNDYKYLNYYDAITRKTSHFENGKIASQDGALKNDPYIVRLKFYDTWSYFLTYVVKTNLPYYNVAVYGKTSAESGWVWRFNTGWKSSNETFSTGEQGEGYTTACAVKIMLAKTNFLELGSYPKTTPNDVGYFVYHNIIRSPYYWYNNKDEWNLSANLLSTKGDYDTFNDGGFTNGFKLYNPGDVETDFKLIVDFNATLTGIKVATAFDSEALDSTLNINVGNEKKNTNDKFLLFDSKTNIIYGLKSKNVNAKTGSVYNDWIKSGLWFKIPKNSNTQYGFYLIDYGKRKGNNIPDPVAPILQYDYLYF